VIKKKRYISKNKIKIKQKDISFIKKKKTKGISRQGRKSKCSTENTF